MTTNESWFWVTLLFIEVYFLTVLPENNEFWGPASKGDVVMGNRKAQGHGGGWYHIWYDHKRI